MNKQKLEDAAHVASVEAFADFTADDDSTTERVPATIMGKWRLTARVPNGGLIPPWHGAVRFDQEDDAMITAVVPLNLLGRLMWRLMVFAKVGGMNVPTDPREAWMTGYRTGRKEEKAEAPIDLQLQQKRADGDLEQARKVFAMFRGHQELHEELRAYLAEHRDSLANVNPDPLDATLHSLVARFESIFGPLPPPAPADAPIA